MYKANPVYSNVKAERLLSLKIQTKLWRIGYQPIRQCYDGVTIHGVGIRLCENEAWLRGGPERSDWRRRKYAWLAGSY